MEKKSRQWGSNVGYILATAGAAIGLGNLWKFPYLMGSNGGFQFLLFYLLFVCILGLPIMITETAIGRMTGSGPVHAYQKLNRRAKIIGVFGVTCAFIILSYYSVIGGWVLKYIASYATTFAAPESFKGFLTDPVEPVIWHFVFMLMVVLLCLKGASGIEKASKFMMPALFVMLLIVVARSLTLPGGEAGLAFMFTMKEKSFTFSSVSAALGQVFYSLSLCMGITVTYGAYLSRKENIPKNSAVIAGLDTSIALLAGLAIFPAVFAFGKKPEQGPSLTFGTLPDVFASMPGGSVFALFFFILMFFAAVTSAIALLECVLSSVLEKTKWNRRRAAILIGTAIFLLGVPSALSSGPLAGVSILNYSVFDFVQMLTDNILMPVGGVMMCIFVGWIWGPQHVVDEVEKNGVRFKLKKAWLFCVRFITPILVLIVTITGFISIYQTVR